MHQSRTWLLTAIMAVLAPGNIATVKAETILGPIITRSGDDYYRSAVATEEGVAWIEGDFNNPEVMWYDGQDVTLIEGMSNPGQPVRGMTASGSSIAGAVAYGVKVWDGQQVRQVRPPSREAQVSSLSMSGDRIAWQERPVDNWPNGFLGNYNESPTLYDGDTWRHLTLGAGSLRGPVVTPTRVVWAGLYPYIGSPQIYTYEDGQYRQITNDTTSKYYTAASDELIAWESYHRDTRDQDVMIYDGEQVIHLGEGGGPVVDGDRLAWIRWREVDGEQIQELMLYDAGSVDVIYTSTDRLVGLALNDRCVSWMEADYANGTGSVIFYDGQTATAVAEAVLPWYHYYSGNISMSDHWLTWTDRSGGDVNFAQIIPEPGMALLLGAGMLGLLSVRPRRRA